MIGAIVTETLIAMLVDVLLAVLIMKVARSSRAPALSCA
jgi:hypothetical protein